MDFVVKSLYQVLVGLYKHIVVIMVPFLIQYLNVSQIELVKSKATNFIKVGKIDYSETKTMSGLVLLLSAIDGLTARHFLLINNRFGPESIFTKWLFWFFMFLLLSVCLI